MFPGPGSFILAQERVESERRAFHREIEAMYRRPDALPDDPRGAGEDGGDRMPARGLGAALAIAVRQIIGSG